MSPKTLDIQGAGIPALSPEAAIPAIWKDFCIMKPPNTALFIVSEDFPGASGSTGILISVCINPAPFIAWQSPEEGIAKRAWTTHKTNQ